MPTYKKIRVVKNGNVTPKKSYDTYLRDRLERVSLCKERKVDIYKDTTMVITSSADSYDNNKK